MTQQFHLQNTTQLSFWATVTGTATRSLFINQVSQRWPLVQFCCSALKKVCRLYCHDVLIVLTLFALCSFAFIERGAEKRYYMYYTAFSGGNIIGQTILYLKPFSLCVSHYA